ncbi:methyltransferase N6AMT1 isoform X4 [Vanacampus margaritifer]
MSASYPTPLYDHAARGDFSEVYDPSEDSFLLIDALEKDAQKLQQMRPCVCVEVGSGSGVVSAFLASLLGPSAIYFFYQLHRRESRRCTLHPQDGITQPRGTRAHRHRPGGKPPAPVGRTSGCARVQPAVRGHAILRGGQHGYRSCLGRWEARPRGHRQISTARVSVAVQSRAVLLGHYSRE